MGTVIKIIIGAFVLLVVGCGAILFFAHKAGSDVQKDFYAVVATGDAAKFKAQLHPDVAKQSDDPLLAAWMKAINERLGAFTGMSGSNFNMSVNQGTNGKEVKSEGIAEFENGTAESNLRLLDDKIVAWEVTSDKLPGNWLEELPDASFYDAKARLFLKAAGNGEADKAWAMMHDNLQKNVGEQKWTPMVAAIKARYAGKLISFDRHEFKAGNVAEDKPAEVVLFYGVKGAEGVTITVRYQLVGLKGHLLGFNFALR